MVLCRTTDWGRAVADSKKSVGFTLVGSKKLVVSCCALYRLRAELVRTSVSRLKIIVLYNGRT